MPEERFTTGEQHEYRILKEWYVDEYDKMNRTVYWTDPAYRLKSKRPRKTPQSLPESYPVGDLSSLFR